jgi:GT2 family glycosyltransferase
VPDVSIMIRAYNEAASLATILERLRRQEHRYSVELVVVDNGSTDATPEVARRAGARVVTLPQDQFSYPRSLNLGMESTTAPIVVSLVGHAFPVGRRWLASALPHFGKPQVAGVYSCVIPHKRSSLADKRLYWPAYLRSWVKGTQELRYWVPGVFCAVNIAMRRALWEEHPFDERFGAGGEDGEWALWALSQGYSIVSEPRFVVRHSHGLGTFSQARQQKRLWATHSEPRPFTREELSFRRIGQGP